jgi:regulatory protein
MRITGIAPQRRRTERVSVQIDGEFRLALPEELVLRRGLRVGQEITERDVAELEREDLLWKAKQAALNLLSHRPRSARELEVRLSRKDFPPEVTASTIQALAGKGLIDDAAFAEGFVRDRVRLRPKGRRRLIQELRVKGVDPEVAEAAVGEVMAGEDVSEVELARAAAAKWAVRRNEEARLARRRLYGYLARRGFSADAVRAVLDEVLPEDG